VAWTIILTVGYEVNVIEGVWDFKGFKNETEFLEYLKNNLQNKTFESGLSVTQSNFTEIPNSLFNLISTKFVTISGIGLRILRKSSFENATVLESIDLSSNKLEELPSQLFINILELRYLDLKRNLIEKIQEGAFEGCKMLNILILGYNKLKKIPSNEFKFLKSINSVDLRFNQIKDYEKLDWNPLDSEELNLKGNQLETLEFEISGVNSSRDQIFRKLDVSSNKLTSISILQSLEYFKASSNKINKIKIGDNVTIENLDLSANELTLESLQSIRKLDSLKAINLSENVIENFTNFFAELGNLRKLYLRNVGLSEISTELFSNLKDLEILDISENVLNELDLKLMLPMKNLKSLIITGNQIKSIENVDLILKFNSLTSISLMNNDWDCVFLRSFFELSKKANITIEQEKSLNLDSENFQGYACFNDQESVSKRSEEIIPHPANLIANDTSKEKLEYLIIKLENLTRIHEKSLELQESSKSETLFMVAAIIMILYFLLQILFFIKDRIERQSLRLRENYRTHMMPLFEDSV
jgi:Leucine-rich repeat (LRR) protein